MVVQERYGLGGSERTLRELGLDLGVSAERVRQVEQTALEKMRAACAAAETGGAEQAGEPAAAGGARLASVIALRSTGGRRTHPTGRTPAKSAARVASSAVPVARTPVALGSHP